MCFFVYGCYQGFSRLEAFGFDARIAEETVAGRVEVDKLHLEGKRLKDIDDDKSQRRDLKRKHREENLDVNVATLMRERKNERERKVKENLDNFSSLPKISRLCSGEEKCCNHRCLEVNISFG